jgi:hypothetical protein
LRAYLETAADLREAWIKGAKNGQWIKWNAPLPSMGDN